MDAAIRDNFLRAGGEHVGAGGGIGDRAEPGGGAGLGGHGGGETDGREKDAIDRDGGRTGGDHQARLVAAAPVVDATDEDRVRLDVFFLPVLDLLRIDVAPDDQLVGAVQDLGVAVRVGGEPLHVVLHQLGV